MGAVGNNGAYVLRWNYGIFLNDGIGRLFVEIPAGCFSRGAGFTKLPNSTKLLNWVDKVSAEVRAVGWGPLLICELQKVASIPIW